MLLNECEALGLLKTIPGGYEITEDCLSHTAVNNKVNNPIYKAICDFCESKGVTSPKWDKDAMSVIQTKYNTVDLLKAELNKRCKRLPKKIAMAYFVAALRMGAQYNTVKTNKYVKVKNQYPF